MRPIIPVLDDIPGDSADHYMGNSGDIVGWNSEYFVVRYGQLKNSIEHQAHRCYSEYGFTWVLCRYSGKIIEKFSGLACNMPESFRNILDDPMRIPEKPDEDKLVKCAFYLSWKSKEICEENECTEDEHKCESYAYFKLTENEFEDITDFEMIDVCSPDYLTQQADLALPLPFEGDHDDLLDAMKQYRD